MKRAQSCRFSLPQCSASDPVWAKIVTETLKMAEEVRGGGKGRDKEGFGFLRVIVYYTVTWSQLSADLIWCCVPLHCCKIAIPDWSCSVLFLPQEPILRRYYWNTILQYESLERAVIVSL